MLRAVFLFFAITLVLARLALAGGAIEREPPSPGATEAVIELLLATRRLARDETRLGEALKAADRALAAARTANDTAGQAEVLADRADLLRRSGRLQEALIDVRGAGEAWKKLDYTPGRLMALITEAGALLWTEPQAAWPLLEQAVALARAEKRHPVRSALILSLYSDPLTKIGRYREAVLLIRAAVEIHGRVAPESREHYLSLMALGPALRGAGDLKGARVPLEHALRIAEKSLTQEAVAGTLLNLGAVATSEGKLAEARSHYLRALAIVEAKGRDSLEVAELLGSLGIVAHIEGNLRSAEDYHSRALEIARRVAPGSAELASFLNNLALAAAEQGDLARARTLHVQALKIKEKVVPESREVVGSLNNLGTVARDQGDLGAARSYHERALKISKSLAEASPDVAASLHGLGVVADLEGDFAAARAAYQEAFRLLEKLGPGSKEVAAALHNLGWLEQRQGDLVAAERDLQSALRILDSLGPVSADSARCRNNLGLVALARNDRSAARSYFQRSLEIFEQVAPGSLYTASALSNLAGLDFLENRPDEALRLAERSWKIAREQGAAVAGDDERQAFGQSAVIYCEKLLALQVLAGRPVEALTTLEQGRAQALQQLLAERGIAGKQVSPEKWTAYLVALRDQQRAGESLARVALAESRLYRELASKTGSGLEAAKLQAELVVARDQAKTARTAYDTSRAVARERWTEVESTAPRLFVKAADPEQARQALPAGTLFLSFYVADQGSYLFAATGGAGGSVTMYPLSPGRAELQAQVDSLRRRLTGVRQEKRGTRMVRVVGEREAVDPLTSQARELCTQLLPAAVRPALSQARRLVISPDGPLWDLPFAVLALEGPAGAKPRYLGLEKPLTYTQSLTLFARALQNRPPRKKSVLTFSVGDPLLIRTGAAAEAAALQSPLFAEGVPPNSLPFAAQEAEEIAALYGTRAVTGAAATEAAVRRGLAGADFVHLATHGYLHPHRSMSSGLLLASPARQSEEAPAEDDGALQAWEIFSQMKLNADLVVLSACETGLGAKVRGEGLVGLTRALQHAEARSIVASQWQVADASTRALMVQFHRALKTGVAKDEALRRAMAAVAVEEKTAHPYFWAPFLLVGDPENNLLGAPGAAASLPAASPVNPPAATDIAQAEPEAPRPPAPLRPGKLDLNEIIKETQKHGTAADELTLVWWVPEEFWRASLQQEPGFNEGQLQEILALIRPYVVVMVMDAKIAADGSGVYRTEAQIRADLQIKDRSGKVYRPYRPDQLGPAAKSLAEQMQAAQAKLAGPGGQHLHVFFLPAANAAGQPHANARGSGQFSLFLGQREFRWRLPLASIVPPKRCPKCREELNGGYRFCPYDGTKLP